MLALRTLAALLRGWFYKIYYPVTGRRFSAGKNFRVFGRLRVRGPGIVSIGDNVVVDMVVTPFTHSPDARIQIGDHCFLNGARFGCAERILVGSDCIIADARILDTNFHSTRADRWDIDAPIKTKEVVIERNVWIAAEAGILPGTRIGENSVVGFGAVCSGLFPPNYLIAGNPAKAIRPIDDEHA